MSRHLTSQQAERLDRVVEAQDLIIASRRDMPSHSTWLDLCRHSKETLMMMARFFADATFNQPHPDDWPEALLAWRPSVPAANLAWAGSLITLARDGFGLTQEEADWWASIQERLADVLEPSS